LCAAGRALAEASCVGDCNGDGQVTINELILGVNIALGVAPVSACEAFANNQGVVDIAQLIKGVNNALEGCPAGPTPTNTPPTVVGTPTATPTTGGEELGTHTCNLIPGMDASRISLNVAALPVPLAFSLNGSVSLSCGAVGDGGIASCTCDVQTIAPVVIPNIGVVCIAKSEKPCDAAEIACNGGPPLGIDLTSNATTGSCTGNADCVTSCDTYCNSIGAVTSSGACTGFCSAGTMQACSLDADCLPDNGACNGPDPVGDKADICQCTCVDAAAGGNSRPGEFQCNLGSDLNVENAAPCDGTDIKIAVGSTCVAMTTGTASSIVNNTNFTEGATLPASGPLEAQGSPTSCDNLKADNLTGLKVRGVVNFFGSALGDIVTGLYADCSGPPAP
jgi:hypothetical protein